MIGVYDYTVLATYLSLAFGVSGILAAMNGSPYSALLCLMVSWPAGRLRRPHRPHEEKTAPSRKSASAFRSTRSTTWSASACSPGVIGASLGGGEWWLRASVLFLYSRRAHPPCLLQRHGGGAPERHE